MKKKTWIMVILMALCTGSAMAEVEVLYQDSFDTNPGQLKGRIPDITTTVGGNSVKWNGSLNLTVTNGVMMTKADSVSTAWLYMADFATTGIVIRISAVMVGNVYLNTQYLAVGLTTMAGAPYLKGAPYVTMKHGNPEDAGDHMGYFNIYGGMGNSNQIDTNPYLTESDGYTTNLNARNTMTFEYDVDTGNMLVWLVSEGGTTVTQYNGSVNYLGVAGAAIPVEDIVFLGVQFTTGMTDLSANPAYIDDVLVELILPEPPEPPEPIYPPSIVGWSVVSNNLMRMVVDAPSTASNYYPIATDDLVSGTITNVAHSDDGVNDFVVTNLAYASLEGTNEVIYIQANDTAGFFSIIGGQ